MLDVIFNGLSIGAVLLVAALGLAIVFGFIAGLSTSYFLCRRVVFHAAKRPHSSEAVRFTLVNLGGLGITFLVYYILLTLFPRLPAFAFSQQFQKVVAYTCGVAAPMALSFLLQKTFTFKQKFL